MVINSSGSSVTCGTDQSAFCSPVHGRSSQSCFSVTEVNAQLAGVRRFYNSNFCIELVPMAHESTWHSHQSLRCTTSLEPADFYFWSSDLFGAQEIDVIELVPMYRRAVPDPFVVVSFSK